MWIWLCNREKVNTNVVKKIYLTCLQNSLDSIERIILGGRNNKILCFTKGPEIFGFLDVLSWSGRHLTQMLGWRPFFCLLRRGDINVWLKRSYFSCYLHCYFISALYLFGSDNQKKEIGLTTKSKEESEVLWNKNFTHWKHFLALLLLPLRGFYARQRREE